MKDIYTCCDRFDAFCFLFATKKCRPINRAEIRLKLILFICHDGCNLFSLESFQVKSSHPCCVHTNFLSYDYV